ncbi:uncharacterized protein J3D65DRAFT_664820 [Phyllosticta citribraziliensis]|uniref:Uncharacterized protein n=1 Tax=Phyllosticta citribraziliensis TaxID=989973 RepID=A0ABR1M4E5_9PEZI
MDEQEEGGSASQRSNIPRAVLVSKTKFYLEIKNEDSDNNAPNDQGITPAVKVSSQIGQGRSAKLRNGVYRQYVVLESRVPFSIQTMMNIDEGPMAGYEAIIVKPSKTFRFLELPRELRDRILLLALLVPEARVQHRQTRTVDYVNSGFGNGFKTVKIFSHTTICTPGLLLVCHQVHAESLPIMYGKTMFEIRSARRLEEFVEKIGHNARFVKTMSITGSSLTGSSIDDLYGKADLLSKLVYLNRLNLIHRHETCESFNSPIAIAEEFYNIATSWIHEVGIIKGNRYAAVDVIKFQDCSSAWNADFRAQLKFYIEKRPSAFRFLQLPRTVRLSIYELAMTDQSDYAIEEIPGMESEPQPGGIIAFHQTRVREHGARVVDRVHPGMIYRSNAVTPGLLQVNRSVHNESLPILYSRNTFSFSFITLLDDAGIRTMLETFFNQIGASVAYIKRLAVARLIPEWRIPPTLIHLEKLYMPMTEGYWTKKKNPIIAARDFYTRERLWIEGVASFRGDRMAVLNIISPTTGHDMNLVSAEHRTWEPKFRAELRRLLLLN